ncbi:hypothetical protein HN695_05240 [Candidatus Woesearchaeota archaeon]|nr:hypothetical protein [Candidatus Woesearchaeota archaeon]MBT6336398.1 hypothetical protein [Candidatus Woesearchaeota archaeon]MBT7927719.1 hypothetical protein [Candidatus Woesearchaeota archaeon]
MDCIYCKKQIKSDFVLGTHKFMGVKPYHDKCFDKANKELGFFKKPVKKVPPSKFNFYIGINIVNFILGVIFLFIARTFGRPLYLIFGLFLVFIGLMFVYTISKYHKNPS